MSSLPAGAGAGVGAGDGAQADGDAGTSVSVGDMTGRRAVAATLTNWDGPIATVDNVTAIAALARTGVWCRGRNGGIVQRELNDSDNSDNSSCHEEEGASIVAAASNRTMYVNSPKNGRRPLPSGYYSSPHRSSGALTSRLNLASRQTTRSTVLNDSMTEIHTADLQSEHEPTSALLDYCKRKFLRPYLALLSLVALNPISTDTTVWRSCLDYFQALLISAMLISGYILQYLCSYRGDRAFSSGFTRFSPTPRHNPANVTHAEEVRTVGELIFVHIVPNILHLSGYLSAVVVCKMVGQEQLQNLIERTFLNSMQPRRLCRMLWVHVTTGFVLFGLLFGFVMSSVLLQTESVQAQWFNSALSTWKTTTKLFLLITLFVQGLTEIIILTNYCIECYLLRVHILTLSHKLLMHTISAQDWMRDMLEYRNLLRHLNKLVAIPVSFFVVMNLTYAFAGFVYLFRDFDFHYSALKAVVLNIVFVLLWLLMGMLPFFMAASVTRVCQTAKCNGHQIRVRPFVYHNTSAEDLNSTLLFASTLDLSAKLFHMPIQCNYLCFAILVVSIVILTLGMCVNLIELGHF